MSLLAAASSPNASLEELAPKFREAVVAALAECSKLGLAVKIVEGRRSQARQEWLYASGRTRKGPDLTNAPSAGASWHGYGLAVDVCHKTRGFEPLGTSIAARAGNEAWFRRVAGVFKKHRMSWGGDWRRRDTPHFQWGMCSPSPGDYTQSLHGEGKVAEVWRLLGASR